MDEGNIVLWVVTNREAVVVVSTGKFRGIKNVVIPGETQLPKDRLGDGVLRMIMNRKYGVAVQRRKRKTQRGAEALARSQLQQKRGNSTSVSEFHREPRSFGSVADVSPIAPQQHQSSCFFIMGQGKNFGCRLD